MRRSAAPSAMAAPDASGKPSAAPPKLPPFALKPKPTMESLKVRTWPNPCGMYPMTMTTLPKERSEEEEKPVEAAAEAVKPVAEVKPEKAPVELKRPVIRGWGKPAASKVDSSSSSAKRPLLPSLTTSSSVTTSSSSIASSTPAPEKRQRLETPCAESDNGSVSVPTASTKRPISPTRPATDIISSSSVISSNHERLPPLEIDAQPSPKKEPKPEEEHLAKHTVRSVPPPLPPPPPPPPSTSQSPILVDSISVASSTIATTASLAPSFPSNRRLLLVMCRLGSLERTEYTEAVARHRPDTELHRLCLLGANADLGSKGRVLKSLLRHYLDRGEDLVVVSRFRTASSPPSSATAHQNDGDAADAATIVANLDPSFADKVHVGPSSPNPNVHGQCWAVCDLDDAQTVCTFTNPSAVVVLDVGAGFDAASTIQLPPGPLDRVPDVFLLVATDTVEDARLRGGASSKSSASSATTQEKLTDAEIATEFARIWPELKEEGWTSPPGSGLVYYLYCMPNVKKKSDRIKRVNTFSSAREVVEFVRKRDALASGAAGMFPRLQGVGFSVHKDVVGDTPEIAAAASHVEFVLSRVREAET